MPRINFFALTRSRFFIPALAALLIVSACFLIYGKALNFGFVGFDDDFHVYANPVLRFPPVEALKAIWLGQSGEAVPRDRLYAPLTMTVFWAQYLTQGLNAFYYHFLNLLLHCANAFFVFLLLRGWIEDKLALCGALIFAIHPLQVEPVVWVSGRKDLLMGFFILAGLLLYRRYLLNLKAHRFILAALCFVAAVFSKPSAVMLIPFLILIDWFEKRTFSHYRLWMEKCLLLIPALVVMVVNLDGYGEQHAAANFDLKRLGFIVQSILFYAGHIVLPLRLSAFYPYPSMYIWPQSDWIVLAAGALTLTACVFLMRTEKRILKFGLLFAGAALIPVLFRNWAYVDGGFASDRYAYLMLPGFILILMTRLSRSMRFFIPIVLIFLFGCLASARVAVWENTEKLARNIVHHYPNAANAHEFLARNAEKEGRKKEALVHYEAAYRADPGPWRSAKWHAAAGDFEKAAYEFNLASSKPGRNALFYEDWGLFYLNFGQYPQAREIFEKGIEISPRNASLYNDLAGAVFYMGDAQQAVQLWEKSLQIDPSFASAYNNLGWFYQLHGDQEKALQFYRKAILCDPNQSRAARNLKRLEDSISSRLTKADDVNE